MNGKVFCCFAVVSFCLSGCSGTAPWIKPPGTGYTVENSRPFDKAYNEVWSDILSFAAKSGMMVEDADKENGIVVAELVNFDDDVADCGKDSSMQVTERRANVNILVQRVGNSYLRDTICFQFIVNA